MVMEGQGKLTDSGLLFITLTRLNPVSAQHFCCIMKTSQNDFFIILVITVCFIDKLIFKQYL